MKRPLRGARSKNLGDQDICEIVEILDGWNEKKLTWNLLIEQIALHHRQLYSRQALYNHIRIRVAFLNRKKMLFHSIDGAILGSPESKRIARLEAENQRLRIENTNLLEQFNRWAYNGYLRQMDPKMRELMNYPLPPIFRDRS